MRNAGGGGGSNDRNQDDDDHGSATDGRPATAADEYGDGETAADLWLFKAIGLYQLLRPGAAGRRLRYAYVRFMWLVVAVQLSQVAGLYSATNDVQRFASMAVLAFNGLMCMVKMFVLLANTDRMWAVLDVARYRYTVCGRRWPTDLRHAGDRVSALLRAFAAFSFGTLIVWVAVPLSADNEYVRIVHRDGTAGRYRVTIDNIWLPGMSETVYNWPPVWAAIYGIEAAMCTANVFSWMMFDCYLITVCFVLNAQFRTLSAGYGTIGHPQVSAPGGEPIERLATSTREKKNHDDVDLNNYENLIVHINDNRNIAEKYDEFFEIVRPVAIIQVGISSISIVGLIFLIALLYLTGWSIVSGPIMKFIAGLLSLTFEFYIFCYSFNYIQIAKCTLNFGLYSSNWTEMNLKFKKTLLLAMNMNNSSHNNVMKLSAKSIIDLELFSRVMNMSYTIVSVLLNSNIENAT